jgi:uncharacterized protein with von Willebrand factor type A (vWA) domain
MATGGRPSLDAAMGRFARLLRAHGLPAGASDCVEALEALAAVDLGDPEEVRLALRTVFPSRQEELPIFDRCFVSFWQLRGQRLPGINEFELPPEPGKKGRPGPPAAAELADRLRAVGTPRVLAVDEWVSDAAADEDPPLEAAAVSDLEALGEKDFSGFTPDELETARRLARRLARRMAGRLARRRRPSARGGQIDLRRSLRGNVSRGELIRLAFRARRPRPARLVVLCDVSGSMDLYSRALVQFLHALQDAFSGMETFTFSTRLTRVTHMLKGRAFAAALEALAAVRDWSGGTRIGESLARFNALWGARLVDRRTVVVILSDGWDTGDPEVLAREVDGIRRRARRLVWLNPLLGQPDYQPLTRGMAAALPLVHAFLPAHNLASLAALERVLRA